MSAEKETIIAQKATILDLKMIFKENSRKSPEKLYSAAEIDDMLDAYVRGIESKAAN